jgi:hypothetical protein
VEGALPVSRRRLVAAHGIFSWTVHMFRPESTFITFGAIAPDGYNGPTSSVTRTLRTATSYEIDYTLDPEAPIGSGIYLVGTCVPV